MRMPWSRPGVIFVTTGEEEGPVGFPTEFAQQVSRIYERIEEERGKKEARITEMQKSLQAEQSDSRAHMGRTLLSA